MGDVDESDTLCHNNIIADKKGGFNKLYDEHMDNYDKYNASDVHYQ